MNIELNQKRTKIRNFTKDIENVNTACEIIENLLEEFEIKQIENYIKDFRSDLFEETSECCNAPIVHTDICLSCSEHATIIYEER